MRMCMSAHPSVDGYCQGRILEELRQLAIRSHFVSKKRRVEYRVPDLSAHWVVLHFGRKWHPATTWPKKNYPSIATLPIYGLGTAYEIMRMELPTMPESPGEPPSPNDKCIVHFYVHRTTLGRSHFNSKGCNGTGSLSHVWRHKIVKAGSRITK